MESIIARAELDRGDIQAIRSILDAHERALDASVEQLSANGNEEAEGKRHQPILLAPSSLQSQNRHTPNASRSDAARR